jgi:hypothetical protein
MPDTLTERENEIAEELVSEFDFPVETAEAFVLTPEASELIKRHSTTGISAYSTASQIAEMYQMKQKSIETNKALDEFSKNASRAISLTSDGIKLLAECVDENTAYVVEDYPFGYRVRCRIRYWVEKATKGQKKGEYRLATQTSHKSFNYKYTDALNAVGLKEERIPNEASSLPDEVVSMPCELWNSVKYSPYHGLVVMYLDPAPGMLGVQRDCLSLYAGPREIDAFYRKWNATSNDTQLTMEHLKDLAAIEVISRQVNQNSWVLFLNENPGWRGLTV